MWMPLLILGGCAAFDSDRNDAIEYIKNVQPLMSENSLLSERILVIAAGIQSGTMEDQAVLEGWTTEVVPMSQHLHLQAKEVNTPDSWTDLHNELVSIWSDRNVAYRDLGEAIVVAEGPIWERAKAQHEATVDREQAWFQSVGARLQPMELMIEQYP